MYKSGANFNDCFVPLTCIEISHDDTLITKDRQTEQYSVTKERDERLED